MFCIREVLTLRATELELVARAPVAHRSRDSGPGPSEGLAMMAISPRSFDDLVLPRFHLASSDQSLRVVGDAAWASGI
jgi:hypothetical protein